MDCSIQYWYDRFINNEYCFKRAFTKEDIEFLWFKVHESQDAPYSLCLMGVMFFVGMGVQVNRKMANECFEKAAKLNFSRAMVILGIDYMYGFGIPRDISKGVKLMKKAVKLGNVDALNNLGIMYITGCGVDADIKKGIEMLQESSRNGCEISTNHLNVLRENGYSVDTYNDYKNHNKSIITKMRQLMFSNNPEFQPLL